MGITSAITAGLGALGVGGATASALAPILAGVGEGALAGGTISGLTGGNIGKGALGGAITGGFIPGGGELLGGTIGSTAAEALGGAAGGALGGVATGSNPLTGALEGGAAGGLAGYLNPTTNVPTSPAQGGTPVGAPSGGGTVGGIGGSAVPAPVGSGITAAPDVTQLAGGGSLGAGSLDNTIAANGAALSGTPGAGATVPNGGLPTQIPAVNVDATATPLPPVDVTAPAPSGATGGAAGSVAGGAASGLGQSLMSPQGAGGPVVLTPSPAAPASPVSPTSSVATPANISAGGNVPTPSTYQSLPWLTPAQNASLASNFLNPSAATGAGGSVPSNSVGNFISSPTLGNFGKLLAANSNLLLPAAGVAADALKGNQLVKGQKQLEQIAANQQAQGQTLQNYLQTGTLPPGVQNSINEAADAAKAQIMSRYASMGGTGSSAMQQELANIDNWAAAQGAQTAIGLLNQGINESNLAGSLFASISNQALQQDQQLSSAFSQLAAAAGGQPTGISASQLKQILG